jgi:hypothetical protein
MRSSIAGIRQIEAIEAGLQAAEAGDVIAHQRVREWLMSWARRMNVSPRHDHRVDEAGDLRPDRDPPLHRSA